MKFLKQGVCLALLGAGLAAAPASLTTTASATPTAAVAGDRGLVRDLRAQADGTVSIKNNPATGEAGWLRADGARGDLLPGVAGKGKSAAVDKADAFVDQYGAVLGAASGDLVRQAVDTTDYGWTVRYAQVHDGVPVFGSMVKANVDPQGDLTSVNGYAAPDLDVSTKPATSAAAAERLAVSYVKKSPPSDEAGEPADLSGLEATSELVIYRTGFLKGERGTAHLAYAVEVANGKDVRDQVILDAQDSRLLNRYSMVHDALDRELYEATGTPTAPVLTKVWEEGQSTAGLNVDQKNLVDSSGESYWFFDNAFDRDSYDGEGATRITVNNDPRIDCPNANWNGVTTNYCDGVTSDDIVAHEWGHAYTEYTSGLIYQYQSGALNESYSDVWGETLDLINGREDEGETFATKRPDGQCEPTAPPALDIDITAPANVAGPCFGIAATGAKPFTTTPVSAQVVVATDPADQAGQSTTDGCSAFTNAAAVATKWAYVDRGTCTFATKVTNAKNAGATGIVIGNNNVDPPAGFSGDPALYGVMVTQADGVKFKTAGGPVSVTVAAEDISSRTNSTRWLMGEKSEAFGGAIRDMWTPTCYGDPGKVSDVEYKCDPAMTDAGGVHSNSGVPNHAYALAVDGGTYNGQTVTGMGLDRAAAIWWRAQTAYLTPSSNFTDAANGLEASCRDLVGQDIRELTTAPNATPVLADDITTANCAELTKVLTAVEMRTPVTKCNFQPLLNKATPSLCGTGTTTTSIWKENFEDGLVGWERDAEIVFPGGGNAPWQADSSAPGGRTGGVARGVDDPDLGQCTNGAGDFSSRDSIISPVIAMPSALSAPKLSFDHYVATEGGYDGGNIKISVNEGAFTLIPKAAFLFNPYNSTLEETNPLGGEDGFTGSDGGEVAGSWGTSIVDLNKVGVKAGDKVRLRLDMGRDGCGGLDGWYVDNMQVLDCVQTPAGTVATTTTAAGEPKKVKRGKPFDVAVQVSAGSTTPTGTVQVLFKGKVLGTGTLSAGKVTIEIGKKKARKLKKGKNTLVAEYLGATGFAPSEADFVVKVTSKKKRG